jgi:DNA-binding MarR family transcriptional regulator
MSKKPLPALPCYCAGLRRATRVVTQLYDEVLRPLAITITQFTLLQALSLTGEVPQRKLGEILAIDSTTLTRTIALLTKRGWVATRRGADRRERLLSLSNAGTVTFNEALPSWQTAQRQLLARLGSKRAGQLMHLMNEITEAIAE